MKKFTRTNNKLKINTLSKVLLTGLGSVLISGCDNINNECDKQNLVYAPQFKVDECEQKKKQVTSSGSSGFFIGSSNYSAVS